MDPALHRDVPRLEETVPEPDALRQAIRFQIEAQRVPAGIRKLAQAFFQAEDEQHPGVVPEGDAGVAPFDPMQRRAADHGPLRHERHGNAPAAARIPDVRAQLLEARNNRQRECRPRGAGGAHD